MAISFKFYYDAALTSEVNAANPIEISAIYPGGPYTDVQLWLGSATATNEVQAESDPGVDNISISIVDSDGALLGNETTAVKLATSQGGLSGASAGAALAVGATLYGGIAGAFPFWMRFDNAQALVGTYTDISLTTNSMLESPSP